MKLIKGFQQTPVREIRRVLPPLVIFVILIGITGVFRPRFLSQNNLSNVLGQITPLAIVALAQTLVLLLGYIDLSVGAMISLSTVLLVNYSGTGMFASFRGIIIVILAGLLLGLIHAFVILKTRVPPLILTLGTMAIVKGIAYSIQPTPGGSIPLKLGTLLNWRTGLISTPLIILLFIYGLITLAISKTTWGQHIYATGAGQKQAKLAGIKTERIIAGSYIASSLLASVAGILIAGRIYSGDAMIGEPYMMDSMVASVIGGNSILGGAGGPLGTFVGACLLGTLNNILNLFRISAFYQYLLKGILLLATLVAMFKRKNGQSEGEVA
ncbi:MAG TPA: ABC transporter permease [Halanaerobiales bacterium]|nr:ABC transporter permease [Halanaerobiales bacterium]